MKEIWKPINNYENYEISNYGRLRKKGKILKQYENDKGYLYISVSKNNKRKYIRTHRLVAQTFLSNPNNLPEVNHIDENKKNNKADNLEWCTHLYNVRYGDAIKKASESKYKKIIQYSLDWEPIKIWNSIKEATEMTGSRHICDALNGRRKKTYNSYWKYADES